MSDARFLIRISAVFADFADEILARLGATGIKRLGAEYALVTLPDVSAARANEVWKFVRWSVPVEHAWPCQPEKMEGFIEKAAQGVAGKFGSRNPQAVLVGALDGGNRYYKTLASNLRGRMLQVFPGETTGKVTAEEQDPGKESLFCLVGKEGLFCGMISPLAANGFHPGGTKFIRQQSEETISRAGAKVVEALHYLKLFAEPPAEGAHWLELGASPGGMTSELLRKGYRVTAVDRADLDPRLSRAKGLVFVKKDAASFSAEPGAVFGMLLSDMNGEPQEAIRQVARHARHLKAGGGVIFTLKTTGVESLDEIVELHSEVVGLAEERGLEWLATTHLTYNRQEFTQFFRKRA